ncbi:hypothetical protein MASR2M48_00140 [Spirochaetota bacterium]
MNSRLIDTVKKLIILCLGSALILSIVMLASPGVQSRFIETRIDETPVFLDKYIGKNLRDDIVKDLDTATLGFLLKAGLIQTRPNKGPAAYFMAERHYGVISANDPLVKKRLRNRPSSDFTLFRSISTNFYANELVSSSVTAQDGSYVFVNADEQWHKSVLHAYTHAIAAVNAPASVAIIFSNDGSFDPDIRFAFRFIDEVFALLASDMYSLSVLNGGSIDKAWSDFATVSTRHYTDPDSDILKREAEIIMATYDMPQKSAEFYSSCNAFTVWILKTYGRQTLCTLSASFLSGNYESLNQLFSVAGGFHSALEAWQGNASIPF